MIPVSLLLIAGAITLLVLGLWQSSSALLGASIAASLLAAVLLVLGARRSSAVSGPARTGASSPPRTPPARDRAASDRAAGDRAAGDREAGDREAGDRAAGDRAASDRAASDQLGSDRAGGVRARGDHRGDRAPTLAHIPSQHAPPHEPIPREPIPREPGQREPGQVGPAPPALVEPDPPDADGHLDELDDADRDPPDEPAPQQVSAADAARVGRMLTEVLVVDGRPRYHLPGCVHLLGRDNEPLPVGEAVELGFTPCSLCEPDSALLADARRV